METQKRTTSKKTNKLKYHTQLQGEIVLFDWMLFNLINLWFILVLKFLIIGLLKIYMKVTRLVLPMVNVLNILKKADECD